MKKLNTLVFAFILVTSTFVAISAISWLTAWIGLEVNLLSLMPLMKTNTKNKTSSEAFIKYFIVQAMASMILLFGILSLSTWHNWSPGINYSMVMLSLALLMKMGAAPLHFWLPEVISGLTWNLVLIVMTWQKIAPMLLSSFLFKTPTLMSFFVVSSAIVGSIMGLNQTCLRKVLAYSSINHISWMLASLMVSVPVWANYFGIYSLMNISIVLALKSQNIYYMSQLALILQSNKNMKMIFAMNFLSMGGLPPFLGFFPKWVTTYYLSLSKMNFLAIIMIIFSLIALFYYTRLIYPLLTLNSSEMYKLWEPKMGASHMLATVPSILGLPLFCLSFSLI